MYIGEETKLYTHHVYLTDFGVAKVLHETVARTKTSTSCSRIN